MTVQGTLADLNAALNGLTYVSTQYYNGADTLTLVTNDLGNTGVGGPQQATSTVTINVTHATRPRSIPCRGPRQRRRHAAGLLQRQRQRHQRQRRRQSGERRADQPGVTNGTLTLGSTAG